VEALALVPLAGALVVWVSSVRHAVNNDRILERWRTVVIVLLVVAPFIAIPTYWASVAMNNRDARD
jgi:hypothetical protein